MSADSTNIDAANAHADDTTPHSPHGPLTRRLRAIWRLDHRRRIGELQKIGAVNELRSLIFDLALEEYVAEAAEHGTPDLQDYCARFVGLGTPLEASIRRMLDVQQCYDSYVDGGKLAQEPEWPAAGEKFGEFDILENLGQGSVGRVYLARQQRFGDRVVVLKVSPHQGPREGRLLGRLRHPNIVPVHWGEASADNSMGYILMPFLGKSTLQDFLEQKSHSLPVAGRQWMKDSDYHLLANELLDSRAAPPSDEYEAVLSLARQMAAALDYAHRNGVIHGDIKPSNVLLSPSGQPFLIDFNLARERDSLSGPLGGTLPYMAPELLRAFAGDASAKRQARTSQEADVFAFGVLLRNLLTVMRGGEVAGSPEGPPEEAAKKLLAQREAKPVETRERDRRVSRRLEHLVESCLSESPRERPTAERLHAVLSAETGRWPTGRRWLAQRRLKTACAAASAAVLSAALLVQAEPNAAPVAPPYETALQLLDEGNYEQAEAALLPMANDGNGEAAACLAHALHKRGETISAYAWYTRARELGYSSVGLLNNLAALTARHGQGPAPMRLAEALALGDQAASIEGAPLATRLTLLRLGIEGFQAGTYESEALLRLARKVRAESGEDGGVLAMVASALFVLYDAGAGDGQELLDTLAAANRAGAGVTQRQLQTDLRFQSLRGHPGFGPLLEAAPTQASGPAATPETIIDPRVGVATPQRLVAEGI